MRATKLAPVLALLATLPLVAACGASASPAASPTSEPTVAASATPEPTPIGSTTQQSYASVRTITVQARADVLGREIAHLFVTVNVHGPDVPTALDRAEEVNRTVRSLLEDMAFGAEIHDESINAYPAFSSPYYSSPATAYRTMSVEVANSSDLSHTIGVLDEHIRGGILTSDESVNFYVNFDIEEGGPAEQYARTKAIADARAAAEQIAAENGLTLGEILSVVEGSGVALSLNAPLYGPPAPAGGGGGGSGTGYYTAADAEPTVTITVTFAVQ